tara:strand:+ start:9347 stop:10033 length:687 start_codon:yes stop_codon:yes gene_type:complete
MKKNNYFGMGFKLMVPITTGIIPFGAVVGTLCSEAKFNFVQTVGMNIFVYAGAAQLAAIDLMTKQAVIMVVVVTGLVINLRFLLYSAAMAPFLKKSSLLEKFIAAHLLTDQSYAVMSANHDKLPTAKDAVKFYFGASLCMILVWQLSVLAGFTFGNFAPPSWGLDFGVPISFVALVLPTLKNRKYVVVALFSATVSILLYTVPMRLGLIVTATLSIILAMFLTRKKVL